MLLLYGSDASIILCGILLLGLGAVKTAAEKIGEIDYLFWQMI